MPIATDHPRQQQTAQAHAPHEGAEQNAQRDGRGANDELQELEPDDFVDQGRAAAADKEEHKQRETANRCFGVASSRIIHASTLVRSTQYKVLSTMGRRQSLSALRQT